MELFLVQGLCVWALVWAMYRLQGHANVKRPSVVINVGRAAQSMSSIEPAAVNASLATNESRTVSV